MDATLIFEPLCLRGRSIPALALAIGRDLAEPSLKVAGALVRIGACDSSFSRGRPARDRCLVIGYADLADGMCANSVECRGDTLVENISQHALLERGFY